MHISLLSVTAEDLKLQQSMHFSLLSMMVNDLKLQQSMHQVVGAERSSSCAPYHVSHVLGAYVCI